MSENRYLVSDFMKRWKTDFPPNVWEHVCLDGDYVVVPEDILPVEEVPVQALQVNIEPAMPMPSLEPEQQTTESYAVGVHAPSDGARPVTAKVTVVTNVAPEQPASTRKQDKPAHLSLAPTLPPRPMQLSQEGERLLTVSEVAETLRVNESTVRRWIERGTLEAIMLPRRGGRQAYRIRKTALNALLNSTDARPAPTLGTAFEKNVLMSTEGVVSGFTEKTLHPRLLQLPQEGQPYPYICVDELTSRYHRWKHADEAQAWLQALGTREYVVIDTETTGSMRYSQVIEIAVLDRQGEQLFHSLLKPSTPIEPIATSVHSLTWKDVKDAPTFDELCADLYACLHDRLILAYNAAFDIRLLFQTARAFEVHYPLMEAACLMYCYSKVRGERTPSGQYRRFRLADACLAMQIEVPTIQFEGRSLAMLKHRAGNDAGYLYALLQRMMEAAHFHLPRTEKD